EPAITITIAVGADSLPDGQEELDAAAAEDDAPGGSLPHYPRNRCPASLRVRFLRRLVGVGGLGSASTGATGCSWSPGSGGSGCGRLRVVPRHAPRLSGGRSRRVVGATGSLVTGNRQAGGKGSVVSSTSPGGGGTFAPGAVGAGLAAVSPAGR